VAEQPVEREIALAHAGVGAVDGAVQAQDHRHRVLRHRVRRIGGHAGDCHAQPARGDEIDVVEAGRAQRQEAGAGAGERLEHGLVGPVVHEEAGRAGASRQHSGRGRQPDFQIDQAVAAAAGGVGGIQEIPVVGPGAEHGDVHSGVLLLGSWSGCGAGAASHGANGASPRIGRAPRPAGS
jgi:hypothetical protein